MEKTMVIFEATFKKNDGTKRKMKFTRLSDLPSTRKAPPKRKTALPVGSEIVWDVQKSGYRIFNWNTVIGKVVASRA
jgi:hypothetical protein